MDHLEGVKSLDFDGIKHSSVELKLYLLQSMFDCVGHFKWPIFFYHRGIFGFILFLVEVLLYP